MLRDRTPARRASRPPRGRAAPANHPLSTVATASTESVRALVMGQEPFATIIATLAAVGFINRRQKTPFAPSLAVVFSLHGLMFYAQAAQKCCNGRTVSVLEGGYDLQSLARSVSAHVPTQLEA